MENVEAIYPLSPVQESILLDARRRSEPGAHRGQLTCDLHGHVDGDALVAAWQKVVDRHPLLRTAFVWKRVTRPLQVVHKQLRLLLKQLDLGDLSGDEQQDRLAALLRAEREAGIDPAAAPLFRLALFRTGKDAYRLAFSYHRILLDDHSLFSVINEALTIYDADTNRRRANLPERRTYRDYVAWLKHQDTSPAEVFWRQYLGGFTSPLCLSIERTTPAPTAGWGHSGAQRVYLSEATAQAMTELARQHQLQPETLIQGAWALLLSRYSGERDIVFGYGLPPRPAEPDGAQTVLGPFNDMLPARVEIEDDQELLSWLVRLERGQTDQSRYAHVSMAQVQQWSGAAADVPLCRHGFMTRGADALLVPIEGAEISDVRHFKPSDVSLMLTARCGAGPFLEAVYDMRRFEASAVRRMLEQVQSLLEAMIEQPEQPLWRLPVLSPSERDRLLEANDTRAPYPETATLDQLFEQQVERTADACALAFQGQHVSYGELNRRANQLGHQLRRLGVGPEVVVGILMERSPEMVTALLGVLKAGGAFLPLDPTYPLERLAFMLDDSQAAVVLTQQDLLSGLPSSWAQVICLDADWPRIAAQATAHPGRVACNDNLAYVIYTSGSTGRPKGVLLTHRGVANLVEAQSAGFAIGAGSRVLQFASLSFDASVSEIFVTLLKGGSLKLGRQEDLQAGGALERLLQEEAITTVTLPPTVLRAVAAALPELRTVVAAGEACSGELVEKWSGGRRFINAYGPTEATVCATMWECESGEGKPPIGRAISNTRVYILDERAQPVPIGVVGEVYIGGVGLARGYLRQADLTAERFGPDGLGNDGERLYRSGDLGKWREGGEIEYIGRKDQQVKLRGYRIELGEIEAVIAEHAGVRDCAVIVRGEADEQNRLIAYLVEAAGRTVEVSQLRTHARERLPDYMVPSKIVILKEMPLTVSGKIDRQALPEPDHERPDLAVTYEGPRNDIEEKLSRIWAELLKVDGVGIHDNFFELGGHSLLATQLATKVRGVFDVELPVRSLFNAPTIAELAQELKQHVRTSPAAATIHALPRGREGIEQLLARLGQMSDSDAELILQKRNLLAKRSNENE